MIRDTSMMQTQTSYSDGTVRVPSDVPQPTGFGAISTDSSVIFEWDTMTQSEISGFNIEYWDVTAPREKEVFSTYNTDSFENHSIPLGRQYMFAIATFDTAGVLSERDSMSQPLNHKSTDKNNAPFFGFTNYDSLRLYVGEQKQFDFGATDFDGNSGDQLYYTLQQASSGMTINSRTGIVTWQPTEAQLGYNDVKLNVMDGHGAQDSLEVQILVEKPKQVFVDFNRTYYHDSTSFAMLRIVDNTANRSLTKTDQITGITLAASHDTVTLEGTEQSKNSGVFYRSYDLSQMTLSQGDSITAIYYSAFANEKTVDVAYWDTIPKNVPDDTTVIPDIDRSYQHELYQNYPNPFREQTTVHYSVAQQANVTISVYNLMGTKVSTLVDSKHRPGDYKVRWNGKNEDGKSLSSGVYFYIMRADGFEKQRKMIFMK
jgi:hypothetical protein